MTENEQRDDRSGPGGEGFVESLLRDNTITGTADDPPPPPEEPQAPNAGTTNQPPGEGRPAAEGS